MQIGLAKLFFMCYNNGMRVKAYGKINLSLYITGLAEKMHTLDSVMSTVSVYDEVSVSESDKPYAEIYGYDIPMESNIAYRAAKYVYETTSLALKVSIKKGIPIGGGMGGSSADGAAVLSCAERILKSKGIPFDTASAAATLGSDVYFMTQGGMCRVLGTGNILEPINSNVEFDITMVKCGDVNTGKCYGEYDKLHSQNIKVLSTVDSGVVIYEPMNDIFIKELENGILPEKYVYNALTEPSSRLCANIGVVIDKLKSIGVAAYMTGSGGCIYAFGDKREEFSKIGLKGEYLHSCRIGIEPKEE